MKAATEVVDRERAAIHKEAVAIDKLMREDPRNNSIPVRQAKLNDRTRNCQGREHNLRKKRKILDLDIEEAILERQRKASIKRNLAVEAQKLAFEKEIGSIGKQKMVYPTKATKRSTAYKEGNIGRLARRLHPLHEASEPHSGNTANVASEPSTNGQAHELANMASRLSMEPGGWRDDVIRWEASKNGK